MWENRIILDRFVYHNDARSKIQSKLNELGATDDDITDLHISAGSGYVSYKVTLSNGTNFLIFDNGIEIK